MPKSKGRMFKFYNGDGEVYPFYARDEDQAIHRALAWSRRVGIKLYRKKRER